MNRIARRTVIVWVLIIALTVGVFFFIGELASKGGQWITAPGSPHVYNGGNIDCGYVTDQSGEILLDVDLPEVITKKLTIAAEDISPIHVPEGMAVSIHGSVEVTVSGPARQINNIEAEDISAAVSFDNALVGSGPRELLFSFSSRYPDVTVVGTYTILTTVTEIVTE